VGATPPTATTLGDTTPGMICSAAAVPVKVGMSNP